MSWYFTGGSSYRPYTYAYTGTCTCTCTFYITFALCPLTFDLARSTDWKSAL